MSFLIKDDEVWDKYDKICDVIKDKLGNDMPKENMYYTCLTCITIDSVMIYDKKIIHKFIDKSVNIE